jgi:negative regulator of flagellin synthesis FlgM
MSEINNIKPPLQPDVSSSRDTTSAERANRATSSAGNTSASSNTKADKVSLSDTLAMLEQQLAEVPVVDAARVEAVKLAIEDGSYSVDSKELARKMIGFEGDF